MKPRGSHLLLALLLTSSAAGLLAQPAPLAPTVKVRPRASTPVSAECDESLASQPAPRIQVEEIPAAERGRTADLQPPPARGLRDQLAEAQAAVERNDRTAFNEWLTLGKATVAAYPPGGDRTAATNALAVYDDVARLWDYQFASPTGAFFDATVQNGSLLAAMQRYPGYEEFMARQTITDANGTRFYPTRETREFLARTAAQRLERLGVRAATAPRPAPQPGLTPEPVPRVVRMTPPPQPAPAKRRAATEPVVRSASQPRTSTATTASAPRRRRPTRKTTTTTATTTTTPASSSTSRSTPKRTVTNLPPARVVTATADELPIPPGVVSAPATTTVAPVAPPPVEPWPATTSAVVPDTVATATDTTAVTTAPEPAQQPVRAPVDSRKRNLVFPLLLVLIGVGVLILLFRASA